ncbi:BTAD domain-containing putative transcriptional regulator [Amycolatopsis magusensis]|uniref:DNA-binding SARP family transcriptional activator/DNA-binding CsgD family transcriptional regulator n=1 Tax=Amycolatopsis magusensis TaxID=882444 RepID=A0ABS4PT34_9PSEU|nr:BTAD domain-containing putative transcriptional regulator [Amycolatopsis magusensis]MBP2182580.1 DNA-binding SARP family transcriptional activator/DNA-binding CsgD family transcriptional regulator [Amycolatopsis magusensis]
MVLTQAEEVHSPVALLTARERGVLRAVGRGLSTAEIAAELSIAEVAVKHHLGRIVARLGLGEEEPRLSVVGSQPVPVPPLRLAVLGPLRAWRGAEPVDLGPVRQQALLAALVLRAGTPVSRGELLDAVWGMEPPAAQVVPVYVYRLRKCLRPGDGQEESVIGRDRGGYRFSGEGVELDVDTLEQVTADAAALASDGDLTAAVGRYDDALALYQGEPLSGLPGPFAEGARRRLNERRTVVMQEKLELQLRMGRYADAIGELAVLTSAHPHSEPLAALLMRALYGSGRRADALGVFTRLRRRLVDDLGVEPGPLPRRLHQAVLRGDDLTIARR